MVDMWSTIKAWVYGAVMGAVMLAGVVLYRSGRKDARKDLELDDYENAEDIRRRVSVDRADKLRELDGAGWRD